jgi:two-component system cell cycle response regulator DivK
VAGELILVVDDRALNLKLLRLILERRGYRVSEASSAEQARASVSKRRPELILMDIQLPDVDGLQLTREFKSDIRLRGIPIVAVTSCAMAGDEQRALAAGCDAYVSKPIDKTKLMERVERLLYRGPKSPSTA